MKTLGTFFRILVASAIAALSPVKAQSNAWHELLRVVRFADINRAQLEFDCKQNPLYSSNGKLRALCEKRDRIPDQVIEAAALPYVRKHVSESIAKRAIVQLSSQQSRSVGRKLMIEMATGKQDQLTADEIKFLDAQNRSEVGRAMSAFATDPEQGLAVAKAMLEYSP